MAASTTLQPFLYLLSSNNAPPPPLNHHSKPPLPMSPLLLLFTTLSLLLLLLIIITFSLHKRLKKTEQQQTSSSTTQCYPSKSDPTHLTHSLLLEILPPNSPKWDTLFMNCENPVRDEPGVDLERVGLDCGEKKRKKKRSKKKRPDSKPEDGGGLGEKKEEEGLVCLYPFTTSSSATQRRIKQQYDQLVKCHESDGLTLAQVGQFVNCLIEARNELQHKSDAIQRKFTITKALLFKADRSSFDRLRQQIYKLELEQKRLEEDAFVYNWLQKQLKLSPAYKKVTLVIYPIKNTQLNSPMGKRKTDTRPFKQGVDRSDLDVLFVLAFKDADYKSFFPPLPVRVLKGLCILLISVVIDFPLFVQTAHFNMLEIGACMELQAKSGELTESADSEFEDTISFEELLAQEKKDSFWQKNGKPRTCSG
ncbi:hypothetical protein RHMOL_Rhmol08G0309300 [Rhododendron molle]|uniref:Uncharacterized protein n=1 Tax=Rhododendron molle TaxID=49168 RepID=A0ACC0MU88_RHOML|nr:hypothetical protein RHMOL_Rhmol08G0309300 [Rhododendron molle]